MTNEEAIDVLMYLWRHEISERNTEGEIRRALNMGMAAIKREQRWIPVSERLPEDIKPVIVTWKNTDPKSYYQYIVGKHFIGTAHFKNGKWFWYSSVTEDLLAEYGKCDSEEFDEAIEVVAWCELPEPYKAESEDKLDGDPIDTDKAIEHYEGTLKTLKGIDLEDKA